MEINFINKNVTQLDVQTKRIYSDESARLSGLR